jgi:hypothetical protein
MIIEGDLFPRLQSMLSRVKELHKRA